MRNEKRARGKGLEQYGWRNRPAERSSDAQRQQLHFSTEKETRLKGAGGGRGGCPPQ